MPPRADFYLLKQADDHTQLLTACRIIEKAYLNTHKIYIFCADQSQAETLDKLLWTFRESSFIPHFQHPHHTSDDISDTPILIGHPASSPPDFSDILVNFANIVPDFFHQFERIIEIIPDNPDSRAKARDKYRFYRGHDCELHSHHL